MGKSKKILKIGIGTVVISLIFTVSFAIKYRIDKPVFLKTYIEENISLSEEIYTIGNIEFKYITDISDNRKVVDLEFKENKNIQVFASNYPLETSAPIFFDGSMDISKGEIYGRYALKTIYVQINLEDKEKSDIELNNIEVSFNDGSKINADIGRFIIHKEEKDHRELKTLESSHSSDGRSDQALRVEKDIELIGLESPLFKDIGDRFNLYVDGVDYREISRKKYKKDTIINIGFNDKQMKDIVKDYTAYDVKAKLKYKDKNFNEHYEIIYNLNHIPHSYDMKGIFKYLKARGEI